MADNVNYEGLNQLSQLARDNLNVHRSASAGIPIWQEQWNFDASGNCDWICAYREFESGLFCVRFRIVHSGFGRWLSRDPSGYAAGDVNLVRVVENSPEAVSDTFGLLARLFPRCTSIWNCALATPGGTPPGCNPFAFLEIICWYGCAYIPGNQMVMRAGTSRHL